MSNLTQINGQPNILQGTFKRNPVASVLGKLRAWSKRRQAVRELQAMPDSLLRDLGIERFQIVDVVNNSGEFARIRPTRSATAAIAPIEKAAA